MKNKKSSVLKFIAMAGISALAFFANPVTGKAADIQADPAALQQAVMLQQALAAQQMQDPLQQAVAIQLAQQAQQNIMLMQQQAMADQFAKALLVFQQAQINQQNALQQTYMLNAVQAMQRAQFANMLNTNPNLDYKGHLMDEYIKYQQYGINSFNGYEGLK